MNELDRQQLAQRIAMQIEISMRYRFVTPLAQCFALVALRLFMTRYGIEQTHELLKQRGEELIAKAVQLELVNMKHDWSQTLRVAPPDTNELLEGALQDINAVAHHAQDRDTHERIYKILARFRIFEDMMVQRDKTPKPKVH